jgi:oxygen-independent coproporphyrinogen-3 oxidase
MAEEQPLTPSEAADEALVMGLRLAEGIDPEALAARLGVERLVDWAAVERLCASDHLNRSGPHIRATPAGRLVLDRVLAEIAAT